jgi:hypothetical protein
MLPQSRHCCRKRKRGTHVSGGGARRHGLARGRRHGARGQRPRRPSRRFQEARIASNPARAAEAKTRARAPIATSRPRTRRTLACMTQRNAKTRAANVSINTKRSTRNARSAEEASAARADAQRRAPKRRGLEAPQPPFPLTTRANEPARRSSGRRNDVNVLKYSRAYALLKKRPNRRERTCETISWCHCTNRAAASSLLRLRSTFAADRVQWRSCLAREMMRLLPLRFLRLLDDSKERVDGIRISAILSVVAAV